DTGGSTGFASLWGLKAPAADGSAHNLVITLGSTHHIRFGAWGLAGVDQVTPTGTVVKSSGNLTTLADTVTDAGANGMVFDCGYIYQSTAPSPSANGANTADYNSANSPPSSFDPYLLGSHAAGGASVNMSWTWSGAHYSAHVAVGVLAADAPADDARTWRNTKVFIFASRRAAGKIGLLALSSGAGDVPAPSSARPA